MDGKSHVMNWKDISFVPYYVLQSLFHLVEPEVPHSRDHVNFLAYNAVSSDESQPTFRGQLIRIFSPKRRFNFIGLHDVMFNFARFPLLSSITTSFSYYFLVSLSSSLSPYSFISSYSLFVREKNSLR